LEAARRRWVFYCIRSTTYPKEDAMSERTCAACDCELDASAIAVTIGGQIVEVCCEECAQKLREAVETAEEPEGA
jgi:hypothetical protein